VAAARRVTAKSYCAQRDRAARDVARFLDATVLPDLDRIRPWLQRQADHHTERLIWRFRRHDGA
jgi:hypothetical protein